MDVSGGFVVLMGMGTVFVGLVCIVVLIKIMGAILGKTGNAAPEKPAPAAASAAPAAAVVPAGIPNRPEFVAAVSAAIAEDLGTDVSKIQIHSIKRI